MKIKTIENIVAIDGTPQKLSLHNALILSA
jgi:hypothetical protein